MNIRLSKQWFGSKLACVTSPNSYLRFSRSRSVPSVVKLVGTRKVLFSSLESRTKIGSSTDHLMRQGSEY